MVSTTPPTRAAASTSISAWRTLKTRPIHDVPQPQPAVGAISKSFDPQQVISVTSKPSNPCVRRASLDRVWPCFSGRSVGGSAAGTHASASNHVRPFRPNKIPGPQMDHLHCLFVHRPNLGLKIRLWTQHFRTGFNELSPLILSQ